ncbi:hypothetical protein J2S64_001357 [Paeniglutamicibacter sulfureus]|uniref:Uncharacterized protein n=1 Tax=Paeniglutamicibacter sulfureus TaxID=43666 RepID=A0ABU2BHC3_9MICC|nr:hypothetical protein [Paeniglutamicibacter sulfureus]
MIDLPAGFLCSCLCGDLSGINYLSPWGGITYDRDWSPHTQTILLSAQGCQHFLGVPFSVAFPGRHLCRDVPLYPNGIGP